MPPVMRAVYMERRAEGAFRERFAPGKPAAGRFAPIPRRLHAGRTPLGNAKFNPMQIPIILLDIRSRAFRKASSHLVNPNDQWRAKIKLNKGQ